MKQMALIIIKYEIFLWVHIKHWFSHNIVDTMLVTTN